MADSVSAIPPISEVAKSVADASKASAASAAASAEVAKKRFMGRTVTVREMLGDGVAADLLLWKDWKKSLSLVATVTVLWVLFELSGFSLVTIAADISMILITGVFVWAQLAALLNKPQPKIPEVKLKEETVMEFSEAFVNYVNAFLHSAQSIALGGNYILFFQIMALLYFVSLVGSWFNGLTLTFLSFVLAFTVPYFYDKYEDDVDRQLEKVAKEAEKVYKQGEQQVLKLVDQGKAYVQGKISQVQKKQQ